MTVESSVRLSGLRGTRHRHVSECESNYHVGGPGRQAVEARTGKLACCVGAPGLPCGWPRVKQGFSQHLVPGLTQRVRA